jgi:ankyrin repeat protein
MDRVLPLDERRLTEALIQGSVNTLRDYIKRGWNVNRPVRGTYPLNLVDSVRAMRFLISAGADLNLGIRNRTPLLLNAHHGNEAIVKLLLKNKANPNLAYAGRDRQDFIYGSTPLMGAAAGSNVTIVKQLLSAGADVNARDEHRQNALCYAAASKNLGLVKLLVEAGSNLTDDVLFWPVYNGDEKMTEYLIRHGANANSIFRKLEPRDLFPAKESLLGYAIRSIGEFDYPGAIALQLLRGGADPNVRWLNRPPINLAAFNGFVEITRALIEAGADLEARDSSGNTALGEAAAQGHADVTKLLIAAGAKVGVRGRESKTPLEFARKGDHSEVVEILEQTMRKPTATMKPNVTKSARKKRLRDISP